MRLSAIALALLPGLATADTPGLWGRTVQFNVMVWDDPDQPISHSRDFIATVGQGVEFDLGPVPAPPFTLVPVKIDVTANTIRFDYRGNPDGGFADAVFNGFVLSFVADCVLIAGAQINAKGTTFPLTNDDLLIEPQRLGVNVAGLPYGPKDMLTIDVETTDCPLS